MELPIPSSCPKFIAPQEPALTFCPPRIIPVVSDTVLALEAKKARAPAAPK